MPAEGGAQNEAWIARGTKALLGNYKPLPVVLVGGEGARVRDADGNSYIDFVGGIAVSALGHTHPALVRTIMEQAGKILHTANVVWNEPAIAWEQENGTYTRGGSEDSQFSQVTGVDDYSPFALSSETPALVWRRVFLPVVMKGYSLDNRADRYRNE